MEKFKIFNLKNNIPIMRDKTIKFLNDFLSKYQNANILEIGTGYGYSAKYISKNEHVKKIITLEKDNERFLIAKKWTKNERKINIENISAFDYKPDQYFDCIILDGPKNHQDVLLKKFSIFLKKDGFIFIDNLNLFQNANKKLNKNQLKLKNKVLKFKQSLLLLKNWETKFYEIDDGFAILTKK